MKKLFLFFISFIFSLSAFCQISGAIVKKDGNILVVNILKITEEKIEYVYTNEPEGPLREISKVNIEKIVYSGGKEETFEESSPLESSFKGETEKKELFKSQEELMPFEENLASSSLNRADIMVEIVDGRNFGTPTGKRSNGVTWIPIKFNDNDKNNKTLYFVEDLIRTNLAQEGFQESNSNKNYTLRVIINELFYEESDKFTHIEYYQRCKLNYELVNTSSQEIIFSEEIFTDSVNKRKDFKQMGMPLRKVFEVFRISVPENINRFLKNSNFQSLVK